MRGGGGGGGGDLGKNRKSHTPELFTLRKPPSYQVSTDVTSITQLVKVDL